MIQAILRRVKLPWLLRFILPSLSPQLNAVITSVVKNSKRRSAIFTGNGIICIQTVILVVASFMNHRVSPRKSVRLLNEISKYIRVSGRTTAA